MGWASGTLNIKGSVLESACTLAPDNIFQIVDFGNIPVNKIERDGISDSQPFVLQLINCGFSNERTDSDTFMVSFMGLEKLNKKIIGAGLRLIITDEYGKKIKSEKTLANIYFNSGNIALRYRFYFKKAGRRVSPGEFQTNINIVLQYL